MRTASTRLSAFACRWRACTRSNRWLAICTSPARKTICCSEEFDAAAALERLLARRNEAIADALLDQAVLAGIGNVFKSEICFVKGMHPFRAVGTLTRDEAAATIASAQKLLKANVLEDSGDTDRDFSRAAAAHYARIRSKREPVGLRPRG